MATEMDGLPARKTSKTKEENNKIIKTIILLFPKKLPNWLLQKQQPEKLKLTQNNKNNFSIIFTIFGINKYLESTYKDTK